VHPPLAFHALDLDPLGVDLLQPAARVGDAEERPLELLRRREPACVEEPRHCAPPVFGDGELGSVGGQDALGEVPDALPAAPRVHGHLALRPEELEHLARVALVRPPADVHGSAGGASSSRRSDGPRRRSWASSERRSAVFAFSQARILTARAESPIGQRA
jgi:hypothetical protein